MDLHNLYLHLQGVDLVLLDLHFEDILGHKDYHHTLGFELFHLVAVEEKFVNKLGRLDSPRSNFLQNLYMFLTESETLEPFLRYPKIPR